MRKLSPAESKQPAAELSRSDRRDSDDARLAAAKDAALGQEKAGPSEMQNGEWRTARVEPAACSPA